jgi:hypothetical protein
MANKQYMQIKNDKKWKAIEMFYVNKKTPEEICNKLNIDITTFNFYIAHEKIDVNGEHIEKKNVKFTYVDNIFRKTRYGQCQK